MPVGRVKYKNLRQLLKKELDTDEASITTDLIKKFKHIKHKGEFSRAEFLKMCDWKSPRASGWYKRNREKTIKSISRNVLASRSERKRLELLNSLKGVSIPMASAILMLINPKKYGVIDIRVWQLLYKVGAVKRKPKGQGFIFNDWYQYLCILRHHAREMKVSARTIERTLFEYHRKVQKGRLYE